MMSPEEFAAWNDMDHDGQAGKDALATLYDQARAYGRWEAGNALKWNTSCVGCAGVLDASAAGFFDGERAGIESALRAVKEARSSDPAVQAVVDVLAAKLERMASAHATMADFEPDDGRVMPTMYGIRGHRKRTAEQVEQERELAEHFEREHPINVTDLLKDLGGQE